MKNEKAQTGTNNGPIKTVGGHSKWSWLVQEAPPRKEGEPPDLRSLNSTQIAKLRAQGLNDEELAGMAQLARIGFRNRRSRRIIAPTND